MNARAFGGISLIMCAAALTALPSIGPSEATGRTKAGKSFKRDKHPASVGKSPSDSLRRLLGQAKRARA